jgi:hypothetical protein
VILQICGFNHEQKIVIAELVAEYFEVTGVEVEIYLGREIDRIVALRSKIVESADIAEQINYAHMLFATEFTVKYDGHVVVLVETGNFLVDAEYNKAFEDLGIDVVCLTSEGVQAADQIRALVEGISDEHVTAD